MQKRLLLNVYPTVQYRTEQNMVFSFRDLIFRVWLGGSDEGLRHARGHCCLFLFSQVLETFNNIL